MWPPGLRGQRGLASRTAARFLQDGRLENGVNKQYLAVTS